MEKDYFLKILSKIQDRTASDDEKKFFEAYDRLFDLQPDGLSDLSSKNIKALEKRIRTNIAREIGERKKPASILGISSAWWAAASIFLLVSAGLIFYLMQLRPVIIYTGTAHTIQPSRKGAVLTLANGQRIELEAAAKGLVATEGTTRIDKTAEGVIDYSQDSEAKSGEKPLWNSIVTQRGSIVTIILPDGSKAYLNAGSSLRFPAAFIGAERTVEISGEAEFEVLQQPSRPFVVHSTGQKIQVLGTHFNVNAYPDSKWSKTTLIEGRVALSTRFATRILKPGQQASIGFGNSDHTIEIRQLSEPADFVAWRNGIFHFENSSIQEVMKVFSLWYDVDIFVEPGVHGRLFSGDIHKSLSLEKALILLNYHHLFFEINGRTIRVRT